METRQQVAPPAPSATEGEATERDAGRRRAALRRRPLAPWWFLLPALTLYAFVVLWPSARGVGLAFTDWDGLSPTKDFVGLENFRDILDDEAARAAVSQTLIIAVSAMVLQNVAGLGLALGVSSRIRSRNVLRVLLFAPAVMTPVVTAYLWKYLLAPEGALNSTLGAVGLGVLQQNWLGDPDLALWSVVGVVVWQFAGYSMVIFVAGLQSIPDEIYEAAAVDGAGPVRRFWHVQLPMLAPATTINLMLSLIIGLKLFDQIFVLTNGGPGHASENLTTLIYKSAFQFNEFAYSVALALVLTVFVAVLSAGQYWLLRRQERVTQ
jgi:raffinose/stachyose/melibiose transport system permease protein